MQKLNSPAVFDLEYFFSMTPDLLCVAGFDGFFKKINPAVSKILGYTDGELFSAPINSFIHPDDRQVASQKHLALNNGKSLVNFENRYLTKNGTVVWLSWTSVPILRDEVVFAIAKNITYRKRIEEHDRISNAAFTNSANNQEPTQSEQLWLNKFETIVIKNTGKVELNLAFMSSELALSQRQLFRQIDRILGITPNKLIRIIRMQLAWEAIASGKYRTVKEISNIAGYHSRTYFSKLFKEVYGFNVTELL